MMTKDVSYRVLSRPFCLPGHRVEKETEKGVHKLLVNTLF